MSLIRVVNEGLMLNDGMEMKMLKPDGTYGVGVYLLECGHRYLSGSELCNGESVPCSTCQVEGRRGWDATAPADEYARQRIERFVEVK